MYDSVADNQMFTFQPTLSKNNPMNFKIHFDAYHKTEHKIVDKRNEDIEGPISASSIDIYTTTAPCNAQL